MGFQTLRSQRLGAIMRIGTLSVNRRFGDGRE